MAEAYSGRIVFDADTCENLHAINETNIPLVVSGVSNAVVVATPDGILVSSKEHSAKLKPLVEQAAYTRPMYKRDGGANIELSILVFIKITKKP